MATLSIRLLGVCQITDGSIPTITFASNKERGLLAYLAVESGYPHSREELAALFWPDSSQEAALASLRNALASLRRAIGDREANPPYLLITRETVQFNRASDHFLDIGEILWLAGASHHLTVACEPADLQRRSAALDAYHGPFLQGVTIPDSAAFEEWATLWRELLARLVLEELRRLADYYESCGETSQALEYAQRQVALEPWLEEGHRQVMRILALAGQRSAALAQYAACKRILADELNVVPAGETRQLYDAICSGNMDGLHPRQMLPAPGEPPYRGLCFFDAPDTANFFGREALTARLVERVKRMAESASPQLAVVGASGSGKSSLVRAGVAPALRKLGWMVEVVTPTAHPLQVLGSLECKELLVIDQFEELFSLCRTESERAAFLERIFGSGQPALLVLRADFYGHCAPYPHLRAVLSARQEYIGAMDAAGLRRAIEEPARLAGWELEPGLADLILRDVGVSGEQSSPEPGGLPLLEHALLETWQRRRGRVLTLEGYADSGGVRGAIAQTAERVYGSLSPDDQNLARQVFLRLTELGENTQATRRRAPFSELRALAACGQAVDSLLNVLARARLLTLSEETAEVAHEALIREWPALQGWLAEDRDGLRLHRHLTESAAAWERLGQDEGELYRGARLARALEWVEQGEHKRDLTSLEGEFLHASHERETREALEREAQRQRELEAARRLAETERARAEERTQAAQQFHREERLAYARELAARSKSKLIADLKLSLLLALQAVQVLEEANLPVTWDVQQAVHDVALISRLVWSRETPKQPWAVTYSPDGERVLYEDQEDAHILDAFSGDEILCLRAGGSIGSLFSPDGKYVVTANACQVTLWDANTGEKRVTFPLPGPDPHYGAVNAISPDGTLILACIDFNTAVLLDLRPWLEAGSPASPAFSLPLKRIDRCSWATPCGGFSPDSKMFITAWMEDNTYTLWDSATVQPLRNLVGHTACPEGVSFHPDGRRLASCSYDRTVRIWDIETGHELRCLTGHAGNINLVVYSSDGMRLASSGSEGTVIVWDAESGRKLFDLSTGGLAFGVVFSPDGGRLFTSHDARSVDMWDVTPCGPGEMGVVQMAGSLFWLEGSRDGSLFIEWNTDGTFTARDGYTFNPIDSLIIPPQLPAQDAALAISPDKTQLAVGNEDHLVIWDIKSGQKTLERTVADGWIVGSGGKLAFSPDGKHLAASSDPGMVSIWDLTSGQRDKVLPVSLKDVSMLQYSRDNRFLIAGGGIGYSEIRNGDIYVWDLPHPEVSPKILRADIRGIRNLDISPDSQRVVVCGFASSPEVWDIARGERLLVLQGHTSVVLFIQYSPDGHYLVTASEDGTARVWDATSGAELLCYRVPGQDVVFLALFTPDGRRVVTIGNDGYYRLLAFQDFDELLEIVRKRVTRDWKPEERRRYLR